MPWPETAKASKFSRSLGCELAGLTTNHHNCLKIFYLTFICLISRAAIQTHDLVKNVYGQEVFKLLFPKLRDFLGNGTFRFSPKSFRFQPSYIFELFSRQLLPLNFFFHLKNRRRDKKKTIKNFPIVEFEAFQRFAKIKFMEEKNTR